MTTFERPAGRIKAVYGRTKGLVARRKALMVKGTTVNHQIIEISSSESDEDEDEKENERPQAIPVDKAKSEVTRAVVSIHSKKETSCSESEDEVIKPSRRRNERKARIRGEARRAMLQDEEQSQEEKNEVADLVTAIEKNLKVEAGNDEEGSVEKEEVKIIDKERTSCQALLTLCGQTQPSSFSRFLNQLEDKIGSNSWRKYGEASYSEVYGLHGSNYVVKIIPLMDDEVASEEPLPDRSLASDVHREVEMTRSLARVSDGFVKMYSARIVQGTYPNRLLHARAAKKSQSEETTNASPEAFPIIQKYAALVLRNGGQDLESFEDLSWKQAASIFCQVVDSLSQGEEVHQFEHRDLHWGNIVIAPVTADADIFEVSPLIQGKQIEQFRDATFSGVKATIIDYTLSRAAIGKTLIAYDFADQSLFEGRGDIDMQFDIYRQMKQETNEDWSGFYPHTNVLWLNYLASKLIDEKKIPNPKRRSRLDHRGSEELQCRDFLMQAKQLLLSKRIESAVDLNAHLAAIEF